MKTRNLELDHLWQRLPSADRRLICALIRLLKSARRSQIKEVARTAAEWEHALVFFIKLRLRNKRRSGAIAEPLKS